MIDGYNALGEVRIKRPSQRAAKEEGRGGNSGGFCTAEGGAVAMEAGLPRLHQVRVCVFFFFIVCEFPVEFEVSVEGNLMHPSFHRLIYCLPVTFSIREMSRSSHVVVYWLPPLPLKFQTESTSWTW